MLDEQNGITDGAGLSLLVESLLKLENLPIVGGSAIADVNTVIILRIRFHHGLCEGLIVAYKRGKTNRLGRRG